MSGHIEYNIETRSEHSSGKIVLETYMKGLSWVRLEWEERTEASEICMTGAEMHTAVFW